MLIRGRGRKISRARCSVPTVPEFAVGKLATMGVQLSRVTRVYVPMLLSVLDNPTAWMHSHVSMVDNGEVIITPVARACVLYKQLSP